MFIVSNFLMSFARILDVVLTILYWLILIRALISWVNPDPNNTIVQFLYKATEPVLYPIRRILPVNMSIGLDLSPLIAFLVILFAKNFIVQTLVDLALRLR